MKKQMKKLSLNRETLHALDITGGAIVAAPILITVPQQPFTTSQTISICKYCTTPLDTCPDPTRTIA